MKTDLLASRHIGINEQDTALMLRKIGVNSLDELIDKTIPANIRLKEPLALTSPLTEYEFGKHIVELATKIINILRISVWDGITRLPQLLSSGIYSRTRYGTLLTLLIRQKCRKDAWKR